MPATAKRKAKRKPYGVNPCGCDPEYTHEDLEFFKAVERYKREHGRPFPSWSEVLEIVYALGYRKVAEPQPILKAESGKKRIPLHRSK